MNKFCVLGNVVLVEPRETKNGSPYDIVWVDDQEQQEPIPFALFGYQDPEIGQEIQIEGILENRNGYASISVRRVEGVAKRVPQPRIAGMRQPPPEARKPPHKFSGQVNRNGGPAGDELPF